MNNTHIVVLNKDTMKKLNEIALRNGITHILGVNTPAMNANGWTVTAHCQEGTDINWTHRNLMDDSPNQYRYAVEFCVTYSGTDAPAKSALRGIVKSMIGRSVTPYGGRFNGPVTVDGDLYEKTSDGEVASVKDFTAYAKLEIPADFMSHFDHLYGLGSHIGRLKGALDIAVFSEYENRYHVALIGEPGCGKSDICETLAAMLGDEAVMKFDATATTAAGAIKQIDEADLTPRVLVVEEIEKVNQEALSFLLALMDMRAEIRKTTAKTKVHKSTKILVIATVNNYKLFNGMLAGALASRFANKIWFHRPDVDTLRRILTREVAKLDGDFDWIEPALEYAIAKKITDPRMITALCLCGGDGWLDGSYETMLRDTDKPAEYAD